MWWIFALLAVVAGSAFNLSFKLALNQKVAAEKFFLYIFSGYFLGYILLNWQNNVKMLANPNHWHTLIIWGVIVACFSFLANYFSAKAYQNAPNPGYVEGIKSSNAILTTILGLLLFASPVPWLKWLGIILIPFGLLAFKSKKGSDDSHKDWLMPAIFYAVFLSGMFVVYKYMIANLGFTRLEVLTSLSLFVAIGFLIISLTKKSPWIYPGKTLLVILVGIITGIFTNWLIISAVSLAANPGPSQAIFNCQAIVTMVAASVIFPSTSGGHFDYKKWLGVAIVVIGTIIIVLG
jgi:drug/metabolite transporter (DMT)-like permease